MKKVKLTFFCALLFLISTAACFAKITINVHNQTGEKDAFLYFDYTDTPKVKMTGLSDQTISKDYIYPFKDGSKKPYTFSLDTVNAGVLLYGVLGPESQKTVKAGTKPDENSDAFMGQIEFSYTGEENVQTYWNLTNVDTIGMLCGITSNDPGMTKCGYKQAQTQFASGDLAACGLTTSSPVWKGSGPKIRGTDGKKIYKYNTLIGPTISPGQYSAKYTEYLNLLETNEVELTLYSDDTTKDPAHSGPGLKPSSFTGKFSKPKKIDGIKDVVLQLKSESSFGVTLYFTKDALNGNTIVKGNSGSGLYVKRNGNFVASDVSTNWVNTGPVSATTRFQAWINSVSSRGIFCALNCGEISTSQGAKYDQKDQSTWVPADTTKYGNPYNNYIVKNSNSYGMAYSDAAHSKVQFLTSNNIIVDLYLLAANDPNTSKYYNPDAGKGGNPTDSNYSLGIGANSNFGTITCNGVIFQKTSAGAYGGKFKADKGWQKLEFSQPPNTWIWIKCEGDGSVAGEDCITPNAEFQKSNGLNCLTIGGNAHWIDGKTPLPKPPAAANEM